MAGRSKNDRERKVEGARRGCTETYHGFVCQNLRKARAGRFPTGINTRKAFNAEGQAVCSQRDAGSKLGGRPAIVSS